jgi:Iap family predicted aminopeptidase
MTAKEFIDTLEIIGHEYAKSIPKREIFSLAKEFRYMAVNEVIKLLKAKSNDHRLAAVSILDWKARNKKNGIEHNKNAIAVYVYTQTAIAFLICYCFYR